MEYLHRVWELKSFTYPRKSHVPDLRKKIAPRKKIQRKSTMREKVSLMRQTMAHSNPVVASNISSYGTRVAQSHPGFEHDDDVYSFRTQSRTGADEMDSVVSDAVSHQNSGSTGSSSLLDALRSSFAGMRAIQPGEISRVYFFQGKSYPVKIHSEFHKLTFELVTSKFMFFFILTFIFFNVLLLVLSTFQSIDARFGWYITALDDICLSIFVMELLVKLYALRKNYFYDGWNILDMIVVTINFIQFVVPLALTLVSTAITGNNIFTVLKILRGAIALRSLRVVRMIRFLPNLQVIMPTILKSIKSIEAIVGIIFLFMYIFAVIGRVAYATADPVHFGDIASALLTLFQLLTLDDWIDIYQTIIESPDKWHIILYLLAYIIVEYFVFLNLVVAVLVDNFHMAYQVQSIKEKDDNFIEKMEMAEAYALAEDTVMTKNVADYMQDMTAQEISHLKDYFELLASIEYAYQTQQEQQRILHMMVQLSEDSELLASV